MSRASLRIGEVAAHAGVNIQTLRYDALNCTVTLHGYRAAGDCE